MAEFGSVVKYQGSTTGVALNRTTEGGGGNLFPGTYGSSTEIPVIVVDANGDISDVSTTGPDESLVLMSNASALTLDNTNKVVTFNNQQIYNAGESGGTNYIFALSGYFIVQITLQIAFPGTNTYYVLLRLTVNGVERCSYATTCVISSALTNTVCCNFMLRLNAFTDVVQLTASESVGGCAIDNTSGGDQNTLSIVKVL